MQINEKHLLIGNVRWVRSPNHGGYLENKEPDTIVIHYTAGSSAESSVRSLCSETSKASAHLVIGRDGSIFQLVPFNIAAWHAGVSEHSATGRKGLNRYSIGIELDNAGVLTKQNDESYLSWFGKSYPANEVVSAVHRNQTTERYWHLYTQPQLEACLEVCRVLAARYPIRFVLGHEEISPGRKVDPGPAFPLEKFRDKVLDLDRSDVDELADSSEEKPVIMTVNIDRLNIRTGAGPNHDLARSNPLNEGDTVKVLKHQNKWVQVDHNGLIGWVNGKYLKA
ncbi:MAG: N-acetylmuramoyl-L-alanine amidase [Flavobacteriales bacterium]